ncbi:MAG: hypothetical protein AAF938_14545 [Myxococcota bacterium]
MRFPWKGRDALRLRGTQDGETSFDQGFFVGASPGYAWWMDASEQ